MTSNSPSPSRASRNRSKSENLKLVSREIILGCVEGGLKAMALIGADDMVTDITRKMSSLEYIIRLEKE